MSYRITLQTSAVKSSRKQIPLARDIKAWVNHTLENEVQAADIVIRMVDADEGQQLNCTYRQKDYATNVLSFPYELTDTYVMGDIVLCVPVIIQEASEQQKALLDHWAHLVVHGCLHLLGYDHIKDKDANKMQMAEIKLLKEMGFADPYERRGKR